LINFDHKCKVQQTGFEHYFLTENGLYRLLLPLIKKPIIKEFTEWVHNIIEEIKLVCQYSMQERMKQLEQSQLEMEQVIIKLKIELKNTAKKK
jgi:prophage antirepressor-like protein